jgi:hydrogenase expression/formation protein HypC
MCVGIPSKIVKIDDYMATIDVEGAQREISLLLLNEDVKVGDYVIVHAGFAIQKIQEEDAKENLRLMKKIFGVEDETPTPGKSRKRRKALSS